MHYSFLALQACLCGTSLREQEVALTVPGQPVMGFMILGNGLLRFTDQIAHPRGPFILSVCDQHHIDSYYKGTISSVPVSMVRISSGKVIPLDHINYILYISL